MTDETPKVTAAQSSRAPYAAPRIVVYGALAELTRAIGNKSNNDGGMVTGMKRSI
jgi:hypothetical protein